MASDSFHILCTESPLNSHPFQVSAVGAKRRSSSSSRFRTSNSPASLRTHFVVLGQVPNRHDASNVKSVVESLPDALAHAITCAVGAGRYALFDVRRSPCHPGAGAGRRRGAPRLIEVEADIRSRNPVHGYLVGAHGTSSEI